MENIIDSYKRVDEMNKSMKKRHIDAAAFREKTADDMKLEQFEDKLFDSLKDSYSPEL